MSETNETAAQPAGAFDPKKAGWKSTEFWIAVGMFLVGCWLIEKDHVELGTGLITLSGFSYTGSRHMIKTQALKRVAMFLLLPGLVLLQGCCSGHVSAQAMGELCWPTWQRHDAYVREDQALDPLKQESYLTTTVIGRRILEEAGYEPEGAQEPK